MFPLTEHHSFHLTSVWELVCVCLKKASWRQCFGIQYSSPDHKVPDHVLSLAQAEAWQFVKHLPFSARTDLKTHCNTLLQQRTKPRILQSIISGSRRSSLTFNHIQGKYGLHAPILQLQINRQSFTFSLIL